MTVTDEQQRRSGEELDDRGGEHDERTSDQGGASGRDERGDGDRGRARTILSASPLIWLLLAAAAGWAVWSTATKGSGKPTPVRAVVVPTDASPQRTVAVLPCSAVAPASSKSSAPVQGLDTVVLPHDSGPRVVLVPACSSSGGSSGGASSGSAAKGGAAIVMPPGTQPPSVQQTLPLGGSGSRASGAKAKIEEAWRLPDASRAKVIVVVPCAGSTGSGSSSARPQPPVPESGQGLVMAPACAARAQG
jgi:hypothetical protein